MDVSPKFPNSGGSLGCYVTKLVKNSYSKEKKYSALPILFFSTFFQKVVFVLHTETHTTKHLTDKCSTFKVPAATS